MRSFAKSFDQYLKELYLPRQKVIKQLADIILDTAPKSKIIMNWGMPVFTCNGEKYLAIAAQRDYYSIYIWNFDWKKVLRSRVKNMNTGKDCLRFRNWEDFPKDLIRIIVQNSLPDEV